MNSCEIDADSRLALARAGAVKLGRSLLLITMLILGNQIAQAASDVVCTGGSLNAQSSRSDPPNLIVKGLCAVPIGKEIFFKQVNILKKGDLVFNEARGKQKSETHFWASSIIIETGGKLRAFYSMGTDEPFGWDGGVLTIHLYGEDKVDEKQHIADATAQRTDIVDLFDELLGGGDAGRRLVIPSKIVRKRDISFDAEQNARPRQKIISELRAAVGTSKRIA